MIRRHFLNWICLALFVLTGIAQPQVDHLIDSSYLRIHNPSRWDTPGHGAAVADTNFTVLGRWPWGPCEAVDVGGIYAYIGNGQTFHILDVSNPTAPAVVGEYVTDGYVYDVKVRDGLAYVCIGRALIILDVSNPQEPTKLGERAFGSGAFRVVLSDSFAYVTTLGGFFVVVDVSNPYLPQRRGVLGIGWEFLTCLAVSGRYAYVGSVESGIFLFVVDATNPDSLNGQEIAVGGAALSGFARDTLLYIVSGDSWANCALKTFTISTPFSPRQTGRASLHDGTNIMDGMTVSGDFAYVVTQDSGVYAVNVRDPYSPFVTSRVSHKDFRLPYGSAIAENSGRLYVANYSGMWIIDSPQRGVLEDLSFSPTGGYANMIRIRDNHAFVASAYSGLWILDVSDPQRPRPVGNVQTGGYASDVIVSDTIAYIANWALYSPDTLRGLWLVDIADLSQPRVLGHHAGVPGSTYSYSHENTLAKQGDLIFFAQTTGGDSVYDIIDVSDPRNPRRLSVFTARYHPYYSAVNDSFAYLATPDSGLRTIDITNPVVPSETTGIGISARGITLRDSLAFVMGSSRYFYVVSISNPRSPYIVGSAGNIYNSATSFRMAVQNNFVYWGEFRLGVIDVSNPRQPVQRAVYIPTEFNVKGIAVKGDTIYATGDEVGVWVLRSSIVARVENAGGQPLPSHVELSQNYPNPFNPATSIEFSLPTRSAARLHVYNILGQKVATLIDGALDEGKHRISFDASALASDIYFYRLTTPNGIITKKMLLIR